MFSRHSEQKHAGYVTVSVIVFGTVFAVILGGLVGFIFVQNNAQNIKEDRESALQIAEAGLDYYKWYLAHFPNDLQNGTGEPGPYQIPYNNPEGDQIGTIELDIDGGLFCGETGSIEIESTGWTLDRPNSKRIVFGKYAKPSVAEYSFIINSNVWAGSDRVIIGPYHSNGGVRMDGTNNSLVTSAVSDWLCTSSFGCNPSSTTPGVWGDGLNFNLWQYPVPQVDFIGITLDLVNLKALAQSEGLYFGPVPGSQGYYANFQSDGTVDIRSVNTVSWIWAYNSSEGWHKSYERISTQGNITNYTLPEDCPVVFFEDNLWIEGTIDRKMTVISADLINPTNDTSVILNGNIVYESADGSDGLTVVAEEDVTIPLISPEDMDISGIFIAQNGRFGRDHYTTTGSYDVPWQYDSYVIQNSLDIFGTVVSNGRVGTKWTSGGSTVSGYENRTAAVDTNLSTDPPPLTPTFSNEFTFVEWREVE